MPTATPCPEVKSTPCPDIQDCDVRAAARALVQQLDAEKIEDREKAAAALQAMGKNAAKALAEHISAHAGTASATKAITVLAKIGSDVADDCNVRIALLSAAELPGTGWSVLQFRLAAIDALGEINKYSGLHFSGDDDDPIENFDSTRAVRASDALSDMADCLLWQLLEIRYDDIEATRAAAPSTVIVIGGAAPKPTPTPTPTPAPTPLIPIPQDDDFYDNVSVLQDAQPKLIELADQATVVASSPKASAADPAFTKLADAKSLAASLKKIEVTYLEATKTFFAKKAADQADDKSHWQLKTEAAFDLLSETTQLRDEINAASDFADRAPDLKKVLSKLANIGANDAELKPAVASAINKIFSKPPEKKPAAEGAKKDEQKKDDATAKDGDKAKSKT